LGNGPGLGIGFGSIGSGYSMGDFEMGSSMVYGSTQATGSRSRGYGFPMNSSFTPYIFIAASLPFIEPASVS
jgi:hypothetical protein